jgi:hypothetical protein
MSQSFDFEFGKKVGAMQIQLDFKHENETVFVLLAEKG